MTGFRVRYQPLTAKACPALFAGFLLLSLTTFPALAADPANAPDQLTGEAVDPEQAHFFEQRIRPLLADSCYECHSSDADNLRGGLILDTAAGARIGGDTGPAVVPGQPEQSLLIEAVRYHDEDMQMPPDGRLDDQAIADLEKWVAMGAPDPRPFDPADVPHYEGIDWEAGREHWAFQPVTQPDLPDVTDEDWVRNPIDRFVLAQLEQADLEPAPEANRRTWLRRVSYDLVGLPPTPQEIEAFVNDDKPGAHARVIDRLLASPRYGERWGRHWLDLARYADSNGSDENVAYAHAWRYRDYVIDSFNADKPYDQFITEQLAGDLMPTPDNDAELFERWTALGYLAVGPKVLAEQDKEKMLLDIADEQIDVVSRSLMGLTVACARCHDHKFDPITAEDYYAMAGIFRSTEMMTDLDIVLSGWRERPLETQAMREEREAHAASLETARQELQQTTAQVHASLQNDWRQQAGDYLLAATRVRQGESVDAVAEDQSLKPMLIKRWVEHLAQVADQPASPLALWLAMNPADAEGSPAAKAARQDHLESTTPLAAEHLREADLKSPEQLAATYQQYFTALAEAEASGTDVLERREGRLGEALYTDGQTHKAVPHEPELEPEQLTLEAWVYVAEQGDGGPRRWIVAKNSNEWADGHYALIIRDNMAGAYLNVGGGRENSHLVTSAQGSLKQNQWYHLALTYDNDRLRLYVDGEPAGDARVGKPRTTGNGPLNFGRRPDGFVNFTGRIDEVRLYDRPLSAEQIAARHQQPEQAIDVDPVRAWDFTASPEQLADMEQERLRRAIHEPDGLFAIPDPAEPHYPEQDRERIAGLNERVAELERTLPAEPPTAMGVFEADEPVDLPVHIRGSHRSLADEPTPRRPPEIFEHTLTPPEMPDDTSGRLTFAQWLTDPDHPLTARVMVNRLWQHHFGEGLVRTPSNYGMQGEPPTHPELLDYLARRFMEQGWSIKQMHRHILLSSAYRMSTAHDSVAAAEDPENRLLWRMNRRRLEAEPIRDALLAVGGTIDLTMGGSLMETDNDAYVRVERNKEYAAYQGDRRSVYLPVIRNVLHPMFTIFDYTDAGMTTAQRPSTTVSHQALFMMNAPIVLEQADQFAGRLLAADVESDADRVRRAYLMALSRSADEQEVAEALEYIAHAREAVEAETPDADQSVLRRQAWADFCHLLFASSEFIYVD